MKMEMMERDVLHMGGHSLSCIMFLVKVENIFDFNIT